MDVFAKHARGSSNIYAKNKRIPGKVISTQVPLTMFRTPSGRPASTAKAASIIEGPARGKNEMTILAASLGQEQPHMETR